MSGQSPHIDRRAARRGFERAAGTYAASSRLEADVAARMLARLDYVKISPRRILDAGSGPARDAKALAARYAGAQIVALDFSLEMLRRAGRRRFRFLERNPPEALCAELERLPIRDAAVDLVWSNMALHWTSEPFTALKEFQRVLAPEGLLMFSTLGPDTLKELRAAAGTGRVHAFTDMHDLGDMLLAAGFAAPVMDMEMLTMVYPNAETLLTDLRSSGQTSARADRPRGLAGKAFGAHLRSSLATTASFEVVYGHAWKAAVRERGEQTVKTIGVFKRIP